MSADGKSTITPLLPAPGISVVRRHMDKRSVTLPTPAGQASLALPCVTSSCGSRLCRRLLRVLGRCIRTPLRGTRGIHHGICQRPPGRTIGAPGGVGNGGYGSARRTCSPAEKASIRPCRQKVRRFLGLPVPVFAAVTAMSRHRTLAGKFQHGLGNCVWDQYSVMMAGLQLWGPAAKLAGASPHSPR